MILQSIGSKGKKFKTCKYKELVLFLNCRITVNKKEYATHLSQYRNSHTSYFTQFIIWAPKELQSKNKDLIVCFKN